MNAQQIYQNILQNRGFRELPYQSDFLTNPTYQKPKLPMVLAAGTSSGKTFMAIMKLEIFYSNPANKNKRTLLIPASKTVLRDNVSKELMDFNPSFSYCVATDKTELNQAIKNKCNVIIALPQTISNSLEVLPTFHNFILDEAHQWYFKSTIQSILTKTKPKYQLLLTGSPSRFIAKEDKFIFKFVPVMELYDLGQVTNVKMEVVTSSYDFKQTDYTSSYGNLKPEVDMTDKQSNTALMNVCKEMVKKLKNPIKGLHNVNRLTKNLFSVFGEMEKTIIFCHSLKQADSFYKSLSTFKTLKGKVLVSHSENDKDSQLFEDFRTKDEYKVLIAVDRGRLGFNIPELFNVVDFTMTQSLDMLLQMYGRLLRLSKTDKQKIYYKVATKNTAPYFVDLMTAMLCLTNMEWYSKFNGKNMGGILIPKVVSKTNRNSVSTTPSKKSKSVKPQLSLEDLDIPLDLNLFKQTALHTNNDEFSTIAWTTLDGVRREFFNIKGNGKNNEWLSYDEAKKYIHSLGLKKQEYWNEFVKLRQLPKNIPYSPVGVYKKRGEWKTWADWLGNGFVSAFEIGDKHLSYEDAKKYINKFKFKTSKEYIEYVKNNNIDFLSQAPQGKYRKQGIWKGWGDYLGHGGLSNQDRSKNMIDFESAREFVRSLGLKNRDEWSKFINTSKMPNDIPRWPDDIKVYKQWNGWGDWLGNGRPKGWQKIKGYKNK
jgi:superfamily II DNA or RNA helicase